MGTARFRDEPVDERVHLLEVEGELDLGNAGEVDVRIERAAREGRSFVLVDLSETRYIDSSALAQLLNARQRLSADRGALALVVASPSLRRTFEVRGLGGLFTIVSTREEGLAALAGEAAAD